MGMGFLAGSAVMLLTLVWGSCIAFGSTDFSRTFSSDNQNQKPFSLAGFPDIIFKNSTRNFADI